MQHKNTLKILVLNALLLGALFATPMPAQAEGGGGIFIDFDIVDTSVYSEETDDELVTDEPVADELVADESNGEEEEDSEDAAAGSTGQSEYKYVSIRRF